MKNRVGSKLLLQTCLALTTFSSYEGVFGQSNVKAPPGPTARAISSGRKAVRAMLARASVPGVGVAVAMDGQKLWVEGFGLANLEQKVAVTNKTKFGIGSISKSLTMALVGRLLEEGLLDLDAPVERYLPEFPHKNQKISVRLIAGHLSGLGDDFATASFYTATHYPNTSAALKEILKDPVLSPPRERHFYSTGTYTIIAGVVEKVTGRDFLTAMNDYVIGPLKLTNTVPNDRREIIADRTAFYIQDQSGKSVNAPYFDPSHKWAGAGYLSTAEDLTKLGIALMKPGFLKQSTLDELFRPLVTSSGEKTEFALGWRVGTDKKGRRLIHQPGGGAGISCWLFLYPDERLVITVLSNQTGAPVGGRLADEIADSFIAAKR